MRLPTELWESILLRVDLRTLLTSATRVCRAWTTLIQDSTALQQTLFFAADSRVRSDEESHSSLLVDAFPSVFSKHQKKEDDFQFTIQSWDFIKHPETQLAYMRPEASWRRMLVQQPPIYKIGIWIEQFATIPNTTYYEMPADSSSAEIGIRMEDVFEEMFFNKDLSIDELQVIWWQHFSPMIQEKVKKLEKLRKRSLEAGLILNNVSSSEDVEDSEEDDDDEEEDRKIALVMETSAMVKGMYEKLGLKPKTRENDRWTKRESYDWD
ncbi:hypothetical protein VI817_008858 [Penicillium citrinum]|nr:hypothetical protein VI817_008858 [Penicillium citrinum]